MGVRACRWPRALLGATLLLCGCRDIAEYRHASTSSDLRTDRAPLAADAQTMDSARADATRSDGAGDAASADATSVDDAAGADASAVNDASTTAACAPTAGAIAWKDDMVLCRVLMDGTNQCGAASYCGARWHLCTASEYRLRGGATEQPPGGQFEHYWLASCVRDGAAASEPSDAICGGACVTSTSDEIEVMWPCGQTTFIRSRYTPLGVTSHSSCLHIGLEQPGTAAYWIVYSTSAANFAGAVCCR